VEDNESIWNFLVSKTIEEKRESQKEPVEQEALVIKARSAFEIVRWILNSLKIILLTFNVH